MVFRVVVLVLVAFRNSTVSLFDLGDCCCSHWMFGKILNTCSKQAGHIQVKTCDCQIAFVCLAAEPMTTGFFIKLFRYQGKVWYLSKSLENIPLSFIHNLYPYCWHGWESESTTNPDHHPYGNQNSPWPFTEDKVRRFILQRPTQNNGTSASAVDGSALVGCRVQGKTEFWSIWVTTHSDHLSWM